MDFKVSLFLKEDLQQFEIIATKDALCTAQSTEGRQRGLSLTITLNVSVGADFKSQGFKELGECTKQIRSTEFGGRKESKKGPSEYKAKQSL